MTDLFQANALVPRQQLSDIAQRRAGLIAEIGADRHHRPRRAFRVIVIAAAIVVPATIALAEVGVPSAFFGLGAADRPAAPGDAIDPAMRAKLEQQNAHDAGQAAQGWPASTLDLDQARLVMTTPDGSKLYVIPTTDKNLCVLIEHGGDLGEGSDACLSPLDASRPATGVFEGPTAGRPADLYGVAVDGVVAIETTSDGFPISIPVHDNAYYWSAPSALPGTTTIGRHLVARFADGHTVAAN
jgi:hypothetical protein